MKTCHQLKSSLGFVGIFGHETDISPCCTWSPHELAPHIKISESGEANYRNWLALRQRVTDERNLPFGERQHSKVCFSCPSYFECCDEEAVQLPEQIRSIFISMYPSPCQARCIYCPLCRDGSFDMSKNREQVQQTFQGIVNTIRYIVERGLIAEDGSIAFTSGEISIHPFRDQLIAAAGNIPKKFSSNVFTFSQEVADCLSADSRSTINLSIDCATAKTWHKIKGRDNFHEVIANLKRYKAHCIDPNQIELKYIWLPGINDSHADLEGVVRILEELNIAKITISDNFELPPEEIHVGLDVFKEVMARHGIEIVPINRISAFF